jgi:hypothetical protein
MIIVPNKIRLDATEQKRLESIKNAAYSLELVELCYFVGDEEETHDKACIYGLNRLIGGSAQETYQNVRLFIYHKLQNE